MQADSVFDVFDALEAFVAAPIERNSDALHSELIEQAGRAHIPRDTGRLEDSITQAHHSDHVFMVDRDGVSFGSSAPAARFQLVEIDVDGEAIARVIAAGFSDGE